MGLAWIFSILMAMMFERLFTFITFLFKLFAATAKVYALSNARALIGLFTGASPVRGITNGFFSGAKQITELFCECLRFVLRFSAHTIRLLAPLKNYKTLALRIILVSFIYQQTSWEEYIMVYTISFDDITCDYQDSETPCELVLEVRTNADYTCNEGTGDGDELVYDKATLTILNDQDQVVQVESLNQTQMEKSFSWLEDRIKCEIANAQFNDDESPSVLAGRASHEYD